MAVVVARVMDRCGVVRSSGGGIKSYEGGTGRYRSAFGKLGRLATAEASLGDPVMLQVTAGSLGNGNGSGRLSW